MSYAGPIATLLGLMVFMVVGAYAQSRWIERQVDSAIQGKADSK